MLSCQTQRAIHYIDTHLFSETLTATAVEQHVGGGPHLRTYFRHETGYTIGRWIERARLRHASEQLASSERSVAEIAFEVGYASHEVFCRAFKRVMGVSPTEHRQKRQAKPSSEMVKTRVTEPAILYATRAPSTSAPERLTPHQI